MSTRAGILPTYAAQLVLPHRIGIRSGRWLMWQVSAAGYTPRSYFTQFSEVVCHERHASHAFFG